MSKVFEDVFDPDFEEFNSEPELLTDYYEDQYDQPKTVEFGDYENAEEAFYGRVMGQTGLAPFSFNEILEHCLEPTLRDGFAHVGKLIFWCIVFRIVTQSVILPKRISVHLISFAIGLFVSLHFFYTNSLFLLALALVSYVTLKVCHQWIAAFRGVTMAVVCLTFNISCELFVATPIMWHQVRGAQMILSMKIISLGFDMDAYQPTEDESDSKQSDQSELKRPNKNRRNLRSRFNTKPDPVDTKADASHPETETDLSSTPTLCHFLGYSFCPGNCVFGPWIKYSDYLSIYESPKWNLAWLMKIIFSSIFGFLFLSISTCWNPWLIPDENQRWMLAYRDAMSYRASHYFVSFVSDSANVASGFGCSRETGHWTFQVTEPHNIEVPRSIVEVVVSWNKPMHHWLKTYCFKKALRYGTFVAILSTYFASTVLHGLNFQLGAVLFSLGFYTYTEHRLRQKLSVIFNASIGSRRDANVSHRHKEGEFLSMLINMVFGMLAMFHLAYLGVMFDQQDIQAEGYSWRHTIQKWENLNFASHWVITIEFLIMCLL